MDERDTAVALTEREAYFESLQLWMHRAHLQRGLAACFPYYMMSFAGPSGDAGSRPTTDAGAPPALQYTVPPLYKRLLAEMVDFAALCGLKLALTVLAADALQDEPLWGPESGAPQLSRGLLLLELVYRALVCLLEGWCTARGGATPGKTLLGLRVVRARAVVPAGGRDVLVQPGGPLGLRVSLARAVLKNLLVWPLFPLCFALLVFRHNRTGYDLLCRVLVVEDPPPHPAPRRLAP